MLSGKTVTEKLLVNILLVRRKNFDQAVGLINLPFFQLFDKKLGRIGQRLRDIGR